MNQISERTSNFTSSQVYRLMGKGKKAGELSSPALTYIKEKQREAKLGRSIGSNAFSYSTSWGNFCEVYVHNKLLGLEYSLKSKEVIVHPNIPNFAGSPDLTTSDTVCDIKSPYTMTYFCDLVESIEAGTLEEDYPEYYWQLVSNSILTKKPYAELIVYCPYISEYTDIYQFNENFDWEGQGYDPFEFKWINDAILRDKGQLPYLIEGNYYKNLNKYRFEVSPFAQQDLIDKIEQASKLLAQ